MSQPATTQDLRALKKQRRQLTAVRPLHLESARSYLRRMARANYIDPAYLLTLVTQRQTATRNIGAERPHEMGVLIEELGGPGYRHWMRAWLLSQAPGRLKESKATLGAPFARQRNERGICHRCAAGTGATSYAHWRFSTCERHGRWTVPDGESVHQAQVPDEAQWRRVEARYCRAVRSPRVDADVIEDVWRLVYDNATMLGVSEWTKRIERAMTADGARVGVEGRMAVYPETVRVLEVLGDEPLWGHLPTRWRESDEFRARLRLHLDWVPGDNWVLVEGLTEVMKRKQGPLKN